MCQSPGTHVASIFFLRVASTIFKKKSQCDQTWCAPTSATMSMSKKWAVRPIGTLQLRLSRPRFAPALALLAAKVAALLSALPPPRAQQQSRPTARTQYQGQHAMLVIGSSHGCHLLSLQRSKKHGLYKKNTHRKGLEGAGRGGARIAGGY
jgi:hypothetical protein